MNRVRDAFASAPVVNLDGRSGINLHIMLSSQHEETSQVIGTENSDCDYSWGDVDKLKASSFPLARRPIFHYALYAHDSPREPCSFGGVSRNGDFIYGGASDFLMTLGDPNDYGKKTLQLVEATDFMHELGHNLGLGHGGLDLDYTDPTNPKVIKANHVNSKANYLSVMNYNFSLYGLTKRDPGSNTFAVGHLDYSRFGPDVLPDLDENALSEPAGLRAGDAAKDYATKYFCDGKKNSDKWIKGLQQSIDWNCKKPKSEDPVRANINLDKIPNTFSRLSTTYEWPHLQYRGGAIGAFGLLPELPATTSLRILDEISIEEQRQLGRLSNSGGTSGARCTVIGGPSDDVLYGTAGDDVLCGGGGSDRLIGRGGHDVLLGGSGKDRLSGGPGDDRLNGGPGDGQLKDKTSRSQIAAGGPNGSRDSCNGGANMDVGLDCEETMSIP
jgi:hypothetical protein